MTTCMKCATPHNNNTVCACDIDTLTRRPKRTTRDNVKDVARGAAEAINWTLVASGITFWVCYAMGII